jgi:hypothetical protein
MRGAGLQHVLAASLATVLVLGSDPARADEAVPASQLASPLALSTTTVIAERRTMLDERQRKLAFKADRSWRWVGSGSIIAGIGAAATLTGVTIGAVSNDPGKVRWLTEGGVVTFVAGAALGTAALLLHLSERVEQHAIESDLHDLVPAEEQAWKRVVVAESAGVSGTLATDTGAIAALETARWKRLTIDIDRAETHRTIGLYGLAGGAVVTVYGYLQQRSLRDQAPSRQTAYRTVAWCGAGAMVAGGVIAYLANGTYDRLVEERSVVNVTVSPGLACSGIRAGPALFVTARY